MNEHPHTQREEPIEPTAPKRLYEIRRNSARRHNDFGVERTGEYEVFASIWQRYLETNRVKNDEELQIFVGPSEGTKYLKPRSIGPLNPADATSQLITELLEIKGLREDNALRPLAILASPRLPIVPKIRIDVVRTGGDQLPPLEVPLDYLP